MKVIKPVLIVLSSMMLLILLCVGVVGYIVVTPERITPLLLHFSNRHLNAEVQCETVDITIFSTFPNMGVRLKNGYVIKPAPDSLSAADSVTQHASDTLLRFSSCVISFNPMTYLKKNKLVIHHIHLDRPDIYATINNDGKANWEDLWPANDSAASSDTAAFQMPELNLEQLRITGGKIVYNDLQVQIQYIMENCDMSLTGNLNKDSAQLHLQLDIQALSLWRDRQCMANHIPLQFSTFLQQELVNKRIHIGQARCMLAGIEFDVSGNLQWDDAQDSNLMVNLHYNLHAPSIPKLLAMVPPSLSALPSKLTTSGEMTLNGSLTGVLGANSYPVLRTHFKLIDGKLRSVKHPNRRGIENLQLESEAYIDLTNKTPSSFRIDKFTVQSPLVNFTVSGTVDDLFKNPFIQVHLTGRFNFDRMSRMLPLADSMDTGGQIQMDVSGECFLADVMNLNYGKIKANGIVDVDSVKFHYPAQQISVTAPFLRARFGANVKDTTRRGRERDILFRGHVNSDSIKITFGELLFNSDALSVTFSTSKPKDTASIAPVFSNIKAEKTQIEMGDLKIHAHKATGTALFTAQRDNPSKPEYTLRFALDTLNARTPDFSGRVNTGHLHIKAKPRPQQAHRRNSAADTASRSNRQQTIRNSAANQSIVNMRLQSDEARAALRQWETTGSFDIQGARLRTPYFPTRIQISDGALQFSTDSLYLKTLQLRVGQSSMNLSGKIHGIRQALLYNGRIKADLIIDAQTINLNQLIRAMVAGSNYSSMDSTAKDAITANVMNDHTEIVEVSDTGRTGGVFIVPRNIDFTLQADIKKVLYSKLELEDINTHIFIRNQAIHLPEIKFRSNVGDMQMSFSYQAPDATGAHIGTSVALHHIQVKQLIETFPLFDTLTPMLRSFEGVVECNMVAAADLDSLMNVQFPTAEASCFVKGKDLVLLDGETFTEIAKMLHFKNKQRNLIDSISVEMILRDNHLIIFPFHLAIDRYQAAVGGTQYLNMDFDYHITVLKSPIPFKFGLNLKGNPDHMKIRLAKALYKDIGDPVKKRSLYGVLFNLRNAMEQKIKNDIETIINREPVRRIRTDERLLANRVTTIDDSLRVFFVSDTTGVPPIDSLATDDLVVLQDTKENYLK
ncbi:MAG: AsmA family protein [Prevotellaceae bacterium]|jgi:uncharacterized protein involved in outer membrane biogenesis|nr:AsmA family protein [Prevotellaceae bacterium]